MSDENWYHDVYLKSDHWAKVRELRLDIDGYQCAMCRTAENLEVHHVTYDKLWNEDVVTDLITLCNSCHGRAHRHEQRAKEHAAMFTAFSKSVAENGKNVAAGTFFWYSWPKFTINGGYVNPLDMKALGAMRDEWCEGVGVDKQCVSVPKIQNFASRYTTLRVLELLSEGMNTKEIADCLGVSEKSVLKRRKELTMKIGNWTTVDAASIGGGGQLEAGGYVVMIQKAEDHPADGYVDLTIDIAEGEHAFMYAGLPASDDWRHTYRRYYEGNAAPFFKQFLEALEISNRGKFSIEAWQQRCDEREFVGLELGVIFQKRIFTKKSGKNAGKDGWNLNWFASIPAQDIRNGDFSVPADADERDKGAKPSTAAGGGYDDIDLD